MYIYINVFSRISSNVFVFAWHLYFTNFIPACQVLSQILVFWSKSQHRACDVFISRNLMMIIFIITFNNIIYHIHDGKIYDNNHHHNQHHYHRLGHVPQGVDPGIIIITIIIIIIIMTVWGSSPQGVEPSHQESFAGGSEPQLWQVNGYFFPAKCDFKSS